MMFLFLRCVYSYVFPACTLSACWFLYIVHVNDLNQKSYQVPVCHGASSSHIYIHALVVRLVKDNYGCGRYKILPNRSEVGKCT
jgi:hypothetical protein